MQYTCSASSNYSKNAIVNKQVLLHYHQNNESKFKYL